MVSAAPIETQQRTCPKCGASLSSSIDGLCAACLLRGAVLDLYDEEREELTEPSRIGNYELIEEIARGGMGIVYKARQRTAGRIVALKSLLPQLLHVPGMLPRFQQEIEAVALLDHAAILPIYEVGEHAGLPYFSMKFAEGGSLQSRQEQLRGDWRGIVAIVVKVARGLQHAHERGIVHRDIKPGNILFDAQNEPTIADFGLAKIRALDRQLTLVSSALGSPNYMAPEQVSAEFGEVGPGADIYALGAVLYELLAGQLPIAGEDATATMRLVPTQTPESGIRSRPDMPQALDTIALKCLEKKPKDRYASAELLAQDLERWSSGQRVLAHREKQQRRRRRWAARTSIVLAAIAIPLAAWIAWREHAAVNVDRAAPITTLQSIAVLPFRNAGASREDDYIGATVTDDLLRQLHQIDSLKVIPFRVGNSAAEPFTPRNLAARFGAELVLEGDFMRGPDVLQVHARLWNTQSKQPIWQHAFETPSYDVRNMRTAIAEALITQLQIDIGNDARTPRSSNAMTNSPEAYTNYIKARYLTRWRRPETLSEAARLLRKAIALDPKFARAYSALAYNYTVWTGPPPSEGPPGNLSIDYAQKAISIDPKLSEPYAVLGDYYNLAGQPIDAEINLRKAVALDGHDPATLHLYAIQLFSMGKLQAALEIERRSVALDGANPQPMMWLAKLTTHLGYDEEARRLWAISDELGASHPISAAIARLDLGQTAPLLDWYHDKSNKTGFTDDPQWPRILHDGVIDPAKRAPALRLLHEQERHLNEATAILHYALLGDLNDAFRLAQRYDLTKDDYYQLRVCNLWSPRMAPLRRDPRFADLARHWGFTAYWDKFGMGDYCAKSGTAIRCH